MPKRAGEEGTSTVDTLMPKIRRKDSSSISAEDEFDEDSDCIIVNRIPDVITIDSDSDAPPKKSPKKTAPAPIYQLVCDCNSVNCNVCVKDSDRTKIIKMYKCYPIMDLDNNKRMVSTIASILQISQPLILKVIQKFRKLLLGKKVTSKDPMPTPPPSFPNKIDLMEICTIRRELMGCKTASAPSVLKHCCEAFKHKITPSQLITTLIENGIVWRRIVHRWNKRVKVIISEKEDVRLERITFIRKIQKYREEGRKIIYINEINPLTSDDSASKALIVAAASVDGPIDSVYMKHLTPRNFLRWTSKYVLNKLDNPAIIIMKASSVFRTEHEPQVPLETDSRQNMIAWLQDKRIAFEEDMFKPELFELICLNEHRFQKYWIDMRVKEKGHEVLYIPSGLPDLDPFELIWMTVKINMMAQSLKSFNMNKEFMSIKPNVWKEHFNRVVEIENKYMDIERNFDRTNEYYRIDCDDSENSSDISS